MRGAPLNLPSPPMDILRKELDEIYAAQHLDEQRLDPAVVAQCRRAVGAAVALDNDCRVITDASADLCHIVAGTFAPLLGIGPAPFECSLPTSDEDMLYNRIHPEDLVDKRMLEYEFFQFINTLPAAEKTSWKAQCRIRMRRAGGEYIPVDNSTQVLRTSPAGNMWLIMCRYHPASEAAFPGGISPRLLNTSTGESRPVHFRRERSSLLSVREKEVLSLIRDGKLSKEIASALGISINTVNRHRQNILQKLSVGNSQEAIIAATAMRLL